MTRRQSIRRRPPSATTLRDEAEAVGAGPLRVELDAEQATPGDGRDEPRRRVPSRPEIAARRHRRPARPRTSGRSRSPRPARCRRRPGAAAGDPPGSSRCAAGSAPLRGGPSCPGRTPSVAAPSSSLRLEQELEAEADARGTGDPPRATRGWAPRTRRRAGGPSRVPRRRRPARRAGRPSRSRLRAGAHGRRGARRP